MKITQHELKKIIYNELSTLLNEVQLSELDAPAAGLKAAEFRKGQKAEAAGSQSGINDEERRAIHDLGKALTAVARVKDLDTLGSATMYLQKLQGELSKLMGSNKMEAEAQEGKKAPENVSASPMEPEE